MSTTTLARNTFLTSKIGGLPRAFWALWTGTLVSRTGMMVQPFMGVYLTQARGMSYAAAGTVMAVFGAGSLLSQVLAGWLADRFGRRVTLTGGMLATAAAMVALGYSTSLPALVTMMFVLGVAVDAYRPAANALVADLVPRHDRARAYGLLFWAMNLGFAVAMVAGGWLAQAGYGWMFGINAATALAFGALVWRAVPETLPARDTGEDEGVGDSAGTATGREAGAGRRAWRGGFAAVLSDRLMVAFTLITVVSTLVYIQAFTTLPMAMARAGFPSTAYGTAIAVNGVLIVLLQPLTGDWLGRRDHSVVLATGMAIIGVGFALTAAVSSVAGYTVTIVVWTVGEIVTAGIAGAIVAALAPAHLRGRYSGLYGLAWSGGTALAPLLGTRMLDVSPVALWVTVGAIELVAAAAVLAIGPALRRRMGSIRH
ncbi:MFS family permease [Streptosporangium becharense]|uniref:MFS family permease n=1 Tax=Streptosporangium becharense TaxID=1816182 RepID=A0A7W9ID29_9ACTN|nr:MFS transporter [Streptosporangium becharense]MBB2911947.1 MFS family permease [Streptosporangium becharense]MBB5818494.1 MFS family permease [Streptosporangium becharense]